MTSDRGASLGRGVAVVALAQIARRLADQRRCEELDAQRERAQKAAEERERAAREARISGGQATEADLDELAQEASSVLTHNPDPEIVREVWARLVASRAVGPPTDDVVGVSFSRGPDRANELLGGDYFTARWSEISRKDAWRAPEAGRPVRAEEFAGEPIDVWLDGDGTLWVPSHPARLVNGGSYVVHRGASLRGRRRGLWHKRSIEFVDAVAVDTGLGSFRQGSRDSIGGADSLRASVMAILKARKVQSGDGAAIGGGVDDRE